MSLMVSVFKKKVGSPAKKLVLLKLADNANDQGECWPSYQHIADQCEISRRSAMRHIDSLCKDGLLVKKSRKGPKGNTSNFYLINLGGDNLTPPSDNLTPPSDNLTPGGGDTVSPGISHSFEPVNEPNPIGPSDDDLECGEQNGSGSEEVSTDDAFEIFWRAGMRKANKKKANQVFASALKKSKQAPLEFAERLAADVKRRIAAQQMGFDKMHPTTYLNGERWEDEIPTKEAQPTRQDGRKGFAQPLPTGSYTPTDMDNLPDWMRD